MMFHSISTYLPLVLLLLLVGCGEDPGKPETDTAGTELRQDRERKARQLLAQARVATVPNKIDYLRTLVSFYPESGVADQAHLELVLYLLDEAVARPDEALEAARTFAARHPTAPRVSEAYRMLAYGFKDNPDREAPLLAEWSAFLAKARENDQTPSEQQGRFWLDGAYVAAWQGDKAKALDLLSTAVDMKFDNAQVQLEITFRLGSLQADRGKKAAARATFERALELARAGALGFREEDILKEMEKL